MRSGWTGEGPAGPVSSAVWNVMDSGTPRPIIMLHLHRSCWIPVTQRVAVSRHKDSIPIAHLSTSHENNLCCWGLLRVTGDDACRRKAPGHD